ncbi:bacterioferritin [Rubrivivax gelatinosus]|uniref:Bacterioferritin n=2 Tax=Rubrivivax gelatinosus TaxID=28068 RepID=I0HLR8_RUBGI|nr:bacterioferritin [Rubrivivax gelatinosus]BAL93955.1 bacterioferritin Bfr [Rubrivivax gelatinosus IL144]
MQGHPAILDALNALLVDELAARDQYFIHSRMLSEWGLTKLADRIGHEMEDETGHADALIRRILMLGGTPRMTPNALDVGHDVPSILQSDLAVELRVVQHLREVMALCEAERDYVTRDILLPMLDDTEQDHAHWLEQQLRLIGLVTLPNYLQSQMAS